MTEEEIDEMVAKLPPEAKLLVTLLREQNTQQKQRNEEQQRQNEKLTEQVERLSSQLEKLQQMLFGRRSEKLPPMDKVLRDANPPTETVDGEPMPEDDDKRKKEIRRHSRKKSADKRVRNRQRRKQLPVLEYLVHVPDEAIPEGMTRDDFRVVGDGTTVDRIEHIPSRYLIQRFNLETLASKDGDIILKAPSPDGVSEGCQYGPGVHAHVVTSKCSDSMPLHRISKQLAREGSPVARSTLCSIFHRAAELLQPIYKALLNYVRADDLVHADETTLPVQAKGKCKRGWIWTALSSTAITYTYDPTRGGEVADKLLGDTKGKAMVDGYSGYNGLEHSDRDRCGCWAHARRKVFEARLSAPEADELLALIQKLYRVEHEVAKANLLGSTEHTRRREDESRAIVDEIEKWIAKRKGRYPPKSPLASALGYIENFRTELRRFLDDVAIPLDNNAAERALRIIALGRKNFLFAGHDEGAQNLAVLQSVVATCMLHDVNPYEYIRDVLVRVQKRGVTLDELMPWAWTPAADAA